MNSMEKNDTTTLKDLLDEYIEVVSVRNKKDNAIRNLNPEDAIKMYGDKPVVWHDVIPYGCVSNCLKVRFY